MAAADRNGDSCTPFPKTSNPAQRALEEAGFSSLEQLTTVTAQHIAGLHGVGPKAIRILRAALRERGLAFAGESPDHET